MGIIDMYDVDSMVPICIHSLIKPRDVENNVYSGGMSIL